MRRLALLLPPPLSMGEKAPCINVETSSFGKDWVLYQKWKINKTGTHVK